MNYNVGKYWTVDEEKTVREMWQAGSSAGLIANALGTKTRNAVLGKVHRMRLDKRGSPVRASRRGFSPPTEQAPAAYAVPKLAPAAPVWTVPIERNPPGMPCVRCGCRPDACVCRRR